MLMTSSLGKARKWILGFRLVVLLSITGRKIHGPTEFSAGNDNTHFQKLLYKH